MTKDQYLKISRDPSQDTMEVLFYYYKWKGGTHPMETFIKAFPRWMQEMAFMGYSLGQMYYNVFDQLDQHFQVGRYDVNE